MKRFLLRGALVALLALVLTIPALAQTPRTVEVAGNNTPAVNGANLLNAYNVTVPGTAGPTEPWVVKVDAGIYDLGGAQLVLRNFVDLEGSGRNATFILSSNGGTTAGDGTINVPASANAEVRNLTVQNRLDASGVAVVNNSSELKLSTVNLEVDVGNLGIGYLNAAGNARLSGVFSRVVAGGNARGFQLRSGGPIINEAFSFVASFGTDNIGFLATGNSSPLINDLAIVVLGSSERAVGFSARNEAQPRLINGRVSVSGGIQTRGVLAAENAELVLEEVIVQAANDDGNATGLRSVEQCQVFINDSRLESNTGISNTARVEVTSSITQGNLAAVSNTAATAVTLLGTSKLDGPVAAAPPGVLRCVQSFNGTFTAVAANCL